MRMRSAVGNSGAAIAAGSTVFTLPTGFTPAANRTVSATIENFTAGPPQTYAATAINLLNSDNVTLGSAFGDGGSGYVAWLDGVSFRLTSTL